jgi:hypothetical protein
VRILVAYEDDHRAFGQATAETLRGARQHVEVTVVALNALEAEVARFDPHLVICGPPLPRGLICPRPGWVELPPCSNHPTRICVGGQHWESSSPSLEELLSVVDLTEALVEAGGEYDPC